MALSIPIITEYVGTGLDKFKKELSQAETSTQKAGLVLKKAMLPATAAIGALGVAMFDAAKGAMADEAAAKELSRSLKATTKATDAIVASTEDWISEQGKLLGVTDDQLRPALSKLARATGDVEKAQRLANQAMDISVATGKPLETVVAALEKAYGGNMTALQRLAPEYRDLIKEGASFEEVMAELAKTTGGAAAEAANTAEGRFRILKLQLDETKEAIGGSLIPVIEEGLPVLERFADWAQDNPETFKNIALAIGSITAATVALNAAMAVNPYVAAAAGIAAMALAFERLYTEAQKINKIGGIALRILGLVHGGAAGVGTMLKITNSIYDAILPANRGTPAGGAGSGLRGSLMQELKGIPAMADGGIIRHSPGGTLALIGEGGRDEAVIPLDRMGSMGGNNVTINVNGGDPQAVVDALRRYMQFYGTVPIRTGGV
jgi:hypothetical protein